MVSPGMKLPKAQERSHLVRRRAKAKNSSRAYAKLIITSLNSYIDNKVFEKFCALLKCAVLFTNS